MKKGIFSIVMLLALMAGALAIGATNVSVADGGPILCPKKQPTCGNLPPAVVAVAVSTVTN